MAWNYRQFKNLECTHQSLIEKSEYFLDSGLDDYRKHFEGFLGRRIKNRTDDNIIEQIIPKNLNDYFKKVEDENYYISNVLCLINIVREVLLNSEFIKALKQY